MEYTTLKKLYYTDIDKYEREYALRSTCPFTRYIGIDIKEYNRIKSYPAFVCYTEEMLRLQEQIYQQDVVLHRYLQKLSPLLVDQFALSCLLDEVRASNNVEGINSSRSELREAMESISQNSRYQSILFRYLSIMNEEQIEIDSVQQIRAFYDRFALPEVIRDDYHNKPDGIFFRKNSVDITSGTGKVIHRGLFPEQCIIDAMNVALEMYKDKNIPHLIRIAIFHYIFAYIHPFYDGNGRTARCILSYGISEQLHKLIALRISIVIKKHQKKYYDAFSLADSEINRGDLTPFVIQMLEFISSVYHDVMVILQKKQVQVEHAWSRLEKILPEDKLMRDMYRILLESGMMYGQGVTIMKLSELLGKSRNTIQSRLNDINSTHILVYTSQKKKYYKLNMKVFRII